MAIFVRLFGFVLLLAGLWIAFEVLFEAWDLYQEPEKIERFARAIEKGSNIDKSLVSFRDSVIASDSSITSGADDNDSLSTNNTEIIQASTDSVRISYFLAWIIALLLLLLIARIALGAIKTGGELVLYDMQIKQFAKMLVRETGKVRD